MATTSMKIDNKEHITPLGIYFGVAAALLTLTAITVYVSFINLGGWNVVIALMIASIKGTLVALFFMHLRYDKKIFAVVFSMGLVFLSIFIALTLFDTLRRGDINTIRSQAIKKEAVIYDNMPAPDSTADHDGE